MSASITKSSIDLGIVTLKPEEALKFYRDTVGLPLAGEMPMPGGGTMYRLMAGESVIKVVHPGSAPPAVAAPGGIQGATRYRYWTITVSNLQAVTDRCAAAGYKVPITPREIRPGVSISMVEDPDGNWVEFLQVQ
jgi:catechol 2,3-dioxygenase-like lactoylglutathione lyase family enzyme